MISNTYSLSGLRAEDMQVKQYRVGDDHIIFPSSYDYLRDLKASNKKAVDAGWVNPTVIPPILYDEERKCRIVTRVKENEQHE